MTATFESVLHSALQLPSEQRSRIATRLMQSVDEDESPLSPAWLDEIDRRIARAEAGEGGAVSHSQVMAEVRSLVASYAAKQA